MSETLDNTPVALVDLLDRVLAKGVVVSGDIVISIADVDLVHVSLHALLSSAHEHMPDIAPTMPRDGSS